MSLEKFALSHAKARHFPNLRVKGFRKAVRDLFDLPEVRENLYDDDGEDPLVGELLPYLSRVLPDAYVIQEQDDGWHVVMLEVEDTNGVNASKLLKLEHLAVGLDAVGIQLHLICLNRWGEVAREVSTMDLMFAGSLLEGAGLS